MQTPVEYRTMLGLTQQPSPVSSNSTRRRRQTSAPTMPIYSSVLPVATLPKTVNWMTSGWVGPVKNQVHNLVVSGHNLYMYAQAMKQLYFVEDCWLVHTMRCLIIELLVKIRTL